MFTNLSDPQLRCSVVVIPAYQPSQALLDTVRELISKGTDKIIVVDDGSSPQHQKIFAEISQHHEVDLLRHAVNLGKGQTLKTAFNHYLLNYATRYSGVVTADADGQHHSDDILAVGRRVMPNTNSLVLGCRTFQKDIPLRSYIGNKLTKVIFRLLLGKSISDTQTGLRGIPNSLLAKLMQIRQTGYEFELEMLVQAVRNRVFILEVPIQTIYIENNASSHFNPLNDSLRIYFVFVRFSALSLSTALLDYCLFSIAYFWGSGILMSTVFARVYAGAYNFSIAKAFVFRSKRRLFPEAVRYTTLVVFLLVISYTLVRMFHDRLGINVLLAKVVVESGLFLASFSIQNLFVFSREAKELNESLPAATDWDSYYRTPQPQARITRRITLNFLTSILSRYTRKEDIQKICELGGANSCIYESLRKTYPDANYSIIDNNEYGIELTKKRFADHKRLDILSQDILNTFQADRYDLVVSVGLIEHFDMAGTKQAIDAHFNLVKPGGLVLITYPTATLLYRIVRGISEAMGLWIFHDERPLYFDEVQRTLLQHGKILHYAINWYIFLTQGVILVRANP